MKGIATYLCIGLAVVGLACSSSDKPAQEEDHSATNSVTQKPYGSLPDGAEASLFTLTNASGMKMEVTNYGGIITSLWVPDRDGKLEDVVLGHDSLGGYVASNPYFGAIIGRYGNRIGGGTFSIEGEEYTLPTNDGPNHLHGGEKGYDKVLWAAASFQTDSTVGVVFTRTSPDGEQGYPGNLEAKVSYTLTNDNRLVFDYEASTDKPTVVNLTNHSYFNLSGNPEQTILDHQLELAADRFLPVDKGLIPTGELRPVAGTPFDFQQPTTIGARIQQENEQLTFGLGYDHCWVFADDSEALTYGGSLYEPSSGRLMKFYTTEPAIQFYSGNFLDGTLEGKGGTAYAQRTGLCLETQHYPDSPNKPEFPSTQLNPGETYRSQSVYEFGVK